MFKNSQIQFRPLHPTKPGLPLRAAECSERLTLKEHNWEAFALGHRVELVVLHYGKDHVIVPKN